MAPILAVAKKVRSKHFLQMDGAQLDWSYAYKGKARILQNETMCANDVKMPPEAWYEMYVKPWHQELARVWLRVLFQRLHVSTTGLPTGTSTQRSATGLILQPVPTTDTQTSNWWHQLVMLPNSRCLLVSMKMFRFCSAGLLLPCGPGQARGAEAPRRLVAHFSARREAIVAAPRLIQGWQRLRTLTWRLS